MSGDAGSGLFDDHLDAWQAWQDAPWGRLRYRIVRATLARVCATLGAGSLRVLDVGGANGGDAVPLAALGHRVTILDYSATLLDQAVAAASALDVEDRLHPVHADLDAIPSLGLAGFDLVLCHNVLQYRADVAAAVATVCSAVAHGGAISLIAVNPSSEVMVAALRREDPAEALALLDAETLRTATFDHDVRSVPAAQAEAALIAAGCDVPMRFGIRCVTDFIVNDARKFEPDFSADLERLELALCDREPFVGTARMWQVIGRMR